MFVEWKTISLLWPEVILGAAATSIFVGGAFTKSRAYWAVAALVSYVVAAAALFNIGLPSAPLTGPVNIDVLSLGLRGLALLVGLVFTLIASRAADPELASEFFGSLMLVVLGVMLVASANELALLFLGLEMISIPTYVLLFLGRRDRATSEATMKYFFLSIFSSALLLYGLTLLYGISGTTILVGSGSTPGLADAFADKAALAAKPLGAIAPLALILVIAGLGFKLAIAPLQFYAPDVYQGTTNANAGLLAVAPKIAGIAGLVRLAIVALPGLSDFAWQLLLVLAVLTMTIGNICALWQSNLRRLLAYSSIAHGGYLLIGLAAAAGATSAVGAQFEGGLAAALFYVGVYALANMGAFATLAWLGSPRREVSGVDELAGLGHSHPLAAAIIAVCMFSLAGIPPLAGFWGKLTLFTSAIEIATSTAGGGMSRWFLILSVVAALNAAIAAAYYLRIVAVMFFQPQTSAPPAGGGIGALAAAILCGGLVLFVGAFPGRGLAIATQSEAGVKGDGPTLTRSVSEGLHARAMHPR
ncbi:MAG: NADH-quinone oxidoreductase subunit N [Pirellulaceae bacterium]|nr:NADH-quinone oxidoreductase subunit N [Pirellulaceae bacterium]